MVLIFLRFNVRPEKRKEFIQTLHSVVEDVKKESKCLRIDFLQDAGKNENFLVVEEWATAEDFEDHQRSDIFAVLLGTGSLMIEPPKIVAHSVNHSEKLKI